MSKLVDTAVVIRFLQQLITPFEKTEAFKLGIIDKSGNKLKTPVSTTDRAAYTKFHVVVFNLKKLIEKMPGGKSKLASYAAAAWLLKECPEEAIQRFPTTVQLFEDAAVNAVGGGQVAGIGVGPDGEPGVKKRPRNKYKQNNQLDNTNLLKRPALKV